MASTTLGASPPRESRQSSWEPCGAAAGAKDLADVPRRCCVTWRKRGWRPGVPNKRMEVQCEAPQL